MKAEVAVLGSPSLTVCTVSIIRERERDGKGEKEGRK